MNNLILVIAMGVTIGFCLFAFYKFEKELHGINLMLLVALFILYLAVVIALVSLLIWSCFTTVFAIETALSGGYVDLFKADVSITVLVLSILAVTIPDLIVNSSTE